MSENKMNDIIKASLDGIKGFTDLETSIGKAITTPNGVTVIPVSKVTMGIATGGVDLGDRKQNQTQNFGGGGGSGLSITPVAFLTIGRDAEINLIQINQASSEIEKITNLIEKSPQIIEKIKEVLS